MKTSRDRILFPRRNDGVVLRKPSHLSQAKVREGLVPTPSSCFLVKETALEGARNTPGAQQKTEAESTSFLGTELLPATGPQWLALINNGGYHRRKSY